MIFLEIALHFALGFNIFQPLMLSLLNPYYGQFLAPLTLPALAALALVGAVALFWAMGIVVWRLRRGGSDSSDLTSISVIVAGRNEEAYLGDCLRSILESDYPSDKFELIYVDDHSTDTSLEVAQRLSTVSHLPLKVIAATDAPHGRGPKKHALKEGIQSATGEILLFTDADSRVQPGWARAVVNHYDTETGAVAGATLPPLRQGFWQTMHRMERLMTAYASASALGYGSPASASGQNFSFRKAVFEQVGGYAFPSIASGDDDLMAQAIARAGWKVRFASDPQSVVTDLRPPTVAAQLNAAARHQSTTRFYPFGWRIAFALSIASGALILLMGISSFFSHQVFLFFLLTIASKCLIDLTAVKLFASRLHLEASLRHLLLAEFLLPLYLICRPLTMLKSSFRWHDRLHDRVPQPASRT